MYRSTDALGQPDPGHRHDPRADRGVDRHRRRARSCRSRRAPVGLGDSCAPSKAITTDRRQRVGRRSRRCSTRAGRSPSPTTQGMGTPGDHTVRDQGRRGPRRCSTSCAPRSACPGRASPPTRRSRSCGYSQGGQASAAARRAREHRTRPSSTSSARRPAACPTDLANVATYLNGPGNFYFSFLAFAAVGLTPAYPELEPRVVPQRRRQEPVRVGTQRLPDRTACSSASGRTSAT